MAVCRSFAIALLLAYCGAPAFAQQGAPDAVEATTGSGEKVLLRPNGRWQYVDAAKAADAKKVADNFPENHTRPVDAQGCLFGIGRCIMPGDKDYNRGSLGHR
ncbi:MAG: hypothetical protein ABIS45_05765 [Burkholderiales bacterium]